MDIRDITLTRGMHESRETGVCAMEAVAWLSGEPHSDKPSCACPVISSAMRTLNDAMPDDGTRNTYLKPLLPSLLGSRADERTELARGFIAVDYAVRVFAPMTLDVAGLKDEAKKLRDLKQIKDADTSASANEASREAYFAYRSAEASKSTRPSAWGLYAIYAAHRAPEGSAASDAAFSACCVYKDTYDTRVLDLAVKMLEDMLAVCEDPA
jgi:hypothetical protein